MNTREQILDTALGIMSRKGYDAMSIRDICKVVGIKESTIYYHFKNKGDILSNILEHFISINDEMMNQFENVDYGKLTIDVIPVVTMGYVNSYLLDDYIIKLAKTMAILQNDNQRINDLYRKYFFDMPIDFQKNIFAQLIQAGLIKNYDGEFIAQSYCSFIFFNYSKYIIMQEISDGVKQEFIKCINGYINNFIKVYGVDNE